MTILREFGPKSFAISVTNDVYIETGIGNCHSFKNAMASSFETLHGVEINQQFYEDALEICQDSRVHLHCGSSVDILPKIIDPTKSTTFWLDAHYEGPECWSAKDGQCPLLAELKIIMETDWQHKPVILIDDYALFTSDTWWQRYNTTGRLDRSHWPTFQQIFDILGGCDYKFQLLTANDGILYCW